MSDKSDVARLEFVLKTISDIELIIERHRNIESALNDIEGYHAIMMCFMQIGETLNKIHSLQIREKLPVDLAYKMRNIIVHDYIGVNPAIIKETLVSDFSVLKKTIQNL